MASMVLPLPTFDPQDYKRFFRQIERRMKVEKKTPEEVYDLCVYAIGVNEKTEWIATALEEKVPKAEDQVPSLQDIERGVVQLLEPENLKGFLLRDLDELRLARNQSPREYLQHVRDKVQRAIPEASTETWDQMSIHQAIKGAPDHWRQRLFEANCQTVESLVKKMTTLRLSERAPPSVGRDSVSRVSGSFRGDRSGLNRGVTPRTCYGCGKTGHFIKDCRAQCSKCGKKGHIESKCRVNEVKEKKAGAVKRVNGNREVRMQVQINGREVDVVVDTGSQHNLMKPEVAQQVALNVVTKQTPPLVTAVGEEVQIEGVGAADIMMNDSTVSAEFFIVSELTDDVILGLDTLGELGVLIECRKGQVKTRRVSDDFRGKFQTLFNEEDAHGCIKGVTHRIETSGRPVVSKPYRVPLHQQETVRKQLNDLCEKGVIEKSESSYASPMVVVKKPDDTLRICVNYQALNDQMEKDPYPVPSLSNIMVKLRTGTWFTKLDLRTAYWQIKLDESTKHKTAFITDQGLFQWTVLPMGMKNSGAVFQRALDDILSGLPYVTAYADDVCVFTTEDNLDVHMQQVGEVLHRLQDAGVRLRFEKCEFAKKTIKCLGHEVSHGKVSTLVDKVEDIMTWPEPTSAVEVRQFLGLAGFYRQFVPHYAELAAPLTDLLKKNAPFIWGRQQDRAFEALKMALASPPVLAEADPTKPFVVTTDASDVGCGVVLENDGKPVAYASKRWSVAEAKKSVTEKELAAVIFGVKKFRFFLKGAHFLVVSDHKPLQYLLRKRNAAEHLRDKLLDLAEDYDFDIKYRPGQEIPHADALSRKPVRRLAFESDALKTATEADEEIRALRDELLRGSSGTISSAEIQFYASEKSKYYVSDGVVMRKSSHGALPQVVVPRELRNRVLEMCHDHPAAGHLGVRRTLARLTKSYYWHNVKKDVRNWCRSCLQCARNKIERQHHCEGRGSVPVVGKPGSQWGADILGPLNTTIRGRRYVLVVTDLFTKWVEIFALTDTTAATVARKIAKVFTRFPQCSELLTDQGANFESELVRELCRVLGVKKLRTTPYHPAGNGQTERFNATLCEILRTSCDGQWDEALPWAASAYNSSVHAATGFTPYELMFGSQPEGLAVHELQGAGAEEGHRFKSYVQVARDIHRDVQRNSARALETLQRDLDGRRIPPSGSGFEPGSMVLMKRLRRGGKLEELYEGPYKVLESRRPDYVIQRDDKAYTIHGCHLRPWRGSAEISEREDALTCASDGDLAQETVEDWVNIDEVDESVDEVDKFVDEHCEDHEVQDAGGAPDPHLTNDRDSPLAFLPQRTRSGRPVQRNRRYV